MKVAVFVSGRGSNLQALIDACAAGRVPAEIALAVSDRPGAQGLQRARAASIPAVAIERGADRAAFDRALDAAVREAGCQLICLAGFMSILGADFMRAWRGRVLNIHPSLLPAFPGLNCHARAIAAGVAVSGCTVHFARPEVDSGPIVAQAAVPVLPDDDAATLARRILKAEHRIYPMALALVAAGRVRVVGERARIRGARWATGALLNPDDGVAGKRLRNLIADDGLPSGAGPAAR